MQRTRRPWQVAFGLLALAGLAFSSTACSPEATAREAVERYWGNYSSCAMRIVERESGFDADAVNRHSGTTGLFQIHPTHTAYIKRQFGYEFSEMKDPYKNSRVAKQLSFEAHSYYGDGWQPWRVGGAVRPGGGCPA